MHNESLSDRTLETETDTTQSSKLSRIKTVAAVAGRNILPVATVGFTMLLVNKTIHMDVELKSLRVEVDALKSIVAPNMP